MTNEENVKVLASVVTQLSIAYDALSAARRKLYNDDATTPIQDLMPRLGLELAKQCQVVYRQRRDVRAEVEWLRVHVLNVPRVVTQDEAERREHAEDNIRDSYVSLEVKS